MAARWPHAFSAQPTRRRSFRQLAEDEAQRWETLNVTEWANESFRIDEEFVYDKLDSAGRIRNAYYKPALGIAKTQIMRGGVRLAHLINSIAAGRASGLTL